MLDEEYEEFGSPMTQNNNSGALGQIRGHHVVIACLPAGVCGTVFAATAANNRLKTFMRIRLVLRVRASESNLRPVVGDGLQFEVCAYGVCIIFDLK